MAEALPLVLYFLGSILLVVLIILCVKLIVTMNKIENLVDDISVKIKSLNGLFSIIDTTTDKLALLSDRVVDVVASIIRKIFKKKEGVENND